MAAPSTRLGTDEQLHRMRPSYETVAFSPRQHLQIMMKTNVHASLGILISPTEDTPISKLNASKIKQNHAKKTKDKNR